MITRALLSLLFIFSILPSNSQAADRLRFDTPISLRAQSAVEMYAKETLTPPISDLSIAPTDLNNDGINEYVARDVTCPAPAESCRYLIFADTDNGVVMLGDLQARAIMLGSGFTQGVRDLMIQDNPGNDYIFDQYVWDAGASRYTMVDKGSEPAHAE